MKLSKRDAHCWLLLRSPTHQVHRGVYAAALVLYHQFLPLVREHLQSSRSARVSFTGHSIGGCIGQLLMLMYKARGVLTNADIATVYTFGAPSVFNESAHKVGTRGRKKMSRGGQPAEEMPSA
eukprot:33146-Chlamydomonas_euryale.AAC.1